MLSKGIVAQLCHIGPKNMQKCLELLAVRRRLDDDGGLPLEVDPPPPLVVPSLASPLSTAPVEVVASEVEETPVPGPSL